MISFLTEKYISTLHSAKKTQHTHDILFGTNHFENYILRRKRFKIKCSKMMFSIRHELKRENSITAINALQLFACPSGCL